MIQVLRLFHLLGLILFLGSIIGFIGISEMANRSGDLKIISFARENIHFMTYVITVPGMWILIITGFALGIGSSLMKTRPVLKCSYSALIKWKIGIAIMILLNGTFIIAPLTKRLSTMAESSGIKGITNPEFATHLLKEDIFGTINVIGIIGAIILALFIRDLKNRKEV